jgi:hypothetical protein
MLSNVGPVKKKEALDAVERLTDWELFQSFACELISPNIQMHLIKQTVTLQPLQLRHTEYRLEIRNT